MKNTILILTTIILNNFFPTLLMFIFFIFDSNIIGVEIALLTSALNLICQIFSMHGRNTILTSKVDNFEVLVFERINLSIFFGISAILLIYLINYNLNINTISFIPIILLFWINEIFISVFEKKKQLRPIWVTNILILTYFLSTFLLIYLDTYQFLLKSNFIFSCIFTINLFLSLKKFLIFKNTNFFTTIQFNLKSVSSFFLIFPVFIWRIFIYETFEVDEAALYFMCFAIASLPGTLFLNVIGISLFNLRLTYFFKAIVYVIISFILLNILFKDVSLQFISQIFIKINEYKFFITLIYSLMGSILLIFGIFDRCKKFIKFENKSRIFKVDILNSMVISTLVPLIIFFDGELIHISFLLSGLISFISYKLILNE